MMGSILTVGETYVKKREETGPCPGSSDCTPREDHSHCDLG